MPLISGAGLEDNIDERMKYFGKKHYKAVINIGGGGANLTTNNYTGDGSTTAFTLSLDPSVEQNTFIYIDGVYQQKTLIRRQEPH